MRKLAIAGSVVVGLLAAEVASAEPFSLTAAFSTSGTFTCLPEIPCSGSGTNTVVLGSGSNTATFTFDGVNTTLGITNHARPVVLGRFSSSAGEGFTLPTRRNPNIAILHFNFHITHTEPQPSSRTLAWFYGPGGDADLPLLRGTAYLSLFLRRAPTEGANYSHLVYTFSPVPPGINGVGTTTLTANAGVVPEPATMLLFGAGLAGVVARRRMRTARPA